MCLLSANFAIFADTKVMQKDLYISAIAPVRSEFEEFKLHFRALFQTDNADLKTLLEPLSDQTGKMLRPILVLLTARYFGPVDKSVIHLASSLELLHTSTLIHDDVVDNSLLRRGNPSFNAIFDNKLAVLLGDYVIALGLSEMHETGLADNVCALSELSKTLSSGEISQLFVRSSAYLSEESYFEIISRKTASLFSYCCRLAANTCGASRETAESFAEFGRLAGICFQIRDDIFDYFPSPETGKPSGNDLAEGKFTLPAIYALNNSDRDWSETIRAIRSCSASDETRSEVNEFTVESGGIQYAEERMHSFADSALRSLPEDMPSDLRQAFEDYMSLIIIRKS